MNEENKIEVEENVTNVDLHKKKNLKKIIVIISTIVILILICSVSLIVLGQSNNKDNDDIIETTDNKEVVEKDSTVEDITNETPTQPETQPETNQETSQNIQETNNEVKEETKLDNSFMKRTNVDGSVEYFYNDKFFNDYYSITESDYNNCNVPQSIYTEINKKLAAQYGTGTQDPSPAPVSPSNNTTDTNTTDNSKVINNNPSGGYIDMSEGLQSGSWDGDNSSLPSGGIVE